MTLETLARAVELDAQIKSLRTAVANVKAADANPVILETLGDKLSKAQGEFDAL